MYIYLDTHGYNAQKASVKCEMAECVFAFNRKLKFSAELHCILEDKAGKDRR